MTMRCARLAALAVLLLACGQLAAAQAPAPTPAPADGEAPQFNLTEPCEPQADQEACCRFKVANATVDNFCMLNFQDLFPPANPANETTCETTGGDTPESKLNCCIAKVTYYKVADAWCADNHAELYTETDGQQQESFGDDCSQVTPDYQRRCCELDVAGDSNDAFCKVQFPTLYPVVPLPTQSPGPKPPVVKPPTPKVPAPTPKPKPPANNNNGGGNNPKPQDCSRLPTAEASACCQVVADSGKRDPFCMDKFGELWDEGVVEEEVPKQEFETNKPCADVRGAYERTTCCEAKKKAGAKDEWCDAGDAEVVDCEKQGDKAAACCATTAKEGKGAGEFCKGLLAATECRSVSPVEATKLCCAAKKELAMEDGACDKTGALAAALAPAPGPAPGPLAAPANVSEALANITSNWTMPILTNITRPNITRPSVALNETVPTEETVPSAALKQAPTAAAALLGAALLAVLAA